MIDWQMKSPIAFLIFNRPDTTARVFEEIRRARPPKLLVVADGPRLNCPGEAEKVAATRAIIEQVDWPCEVMKNYADTNLGCKRRVSSGLDWVFQTVEEAIILEDDCLPHPTFFRFCEELLEKYRDDERIATISGNNFQLGRRRTDHSYFFSQYTHIWGWATWRRAWNKYDVEMKLWPNIREGNWLRDLIYNPNMSQYYTRIFNQVYSDKIDTWDYQWTFACLVHNALTILPCFNLVSNIGFGIDATLTKIRSPLSELNTQPMIFPLEHPTCLICDRQADIYTYTHFQHKSLFQRIAHKLCATLTGAR